MNLKKSIAQANSGGYQGIGVALLFITLVISSCAAPVPAPVPVIPTPQGVFAIDPLFREFYKDLGAEPQIGYAISTVFKYDERQCQYTVNVLMCYDPAATGAGRYRLEPIGRLMGIYDDPEANPEVNSTRVVDGYGIYPAFIEIYDSLHGEKNVGMPLTGARFNYEQQRIEQYFENIGFFIRFDDKPGNIHLLPYGVFFCGQDCVYQTDFTLRFLPGKQQIETPFAASLEKISHGLQIFGQPLTKPYLAKDGNLEQVYENAVVYGAPKKLTEIYFRALPSLSGMTAVPPGPKKYDESKNVTFYEVKDGLGYHVPLVFDRFIQEHGGRAAFGDPIADTLFYENNVPRQCFSYFCLDYFPSAQASLQVRMVSLGIKYIDLVDPANIIGRSAVPTDVTLILKKEKQQVGSQDTQTIQVQVLQKPDNEPLQNSEPKLSLMTPDGEEFTYYLPATGPDGRAGLVIPAMVKQPNGALVIYQVCVDIPGASQVCARDAYLIWNGK